MCCTSRQAPDLSPVHRAGTKAWDPSALAILGMARGVLDRRRVGWVDVAGLTRATRGHPADGRSARRSPPFGPEAHKAIWRQGRGPDAAKAKPPNFNVKSAVPSMSVMATMMRLRLSEKSTLLSTQMRAPDTAMSPKITMATPRSTGAG